MLMEMSIPGFVAASLGVSVNSLGLFRTLCLHAMPPDRSDSKPLVFSTLKHHERDSY
jgi:hypothetical protein